MRKGSIPPIPQQGGRQVLHIQAVRYHMLDCRLQRGSSSVELLLGIPWWLLRGQRFQCSLCRCRDWQDLLSQRCLHRSERGLEYGNYGRERLRFNPQYNQPDPIFPRIPVLLPLHSWPLNISCGIHLLSIYISQAVAAIRGVIIGGTYKQTK